MPDYKSPLGILDYLVPDSLEKEVITGFATDRDRSYGDFKPNIDAANQEGWSNITTLLGNMAIPQAMPKQTNKQMIDAAILRGSLELMKPRQPGENLASSLQRSIKAAGGPSQDFAARAKQLRDMADIRKYEDELRKPEDVEDIEYSLEQQDRDMHIASAFGLGDSSVEAFASPLRQLGIESHKSGRIGKSEYASMRAELLKVSASEIAGRPAKYYFQLSESELPIGIGNPEGESVTSNLDARDKFITLRLRLESGIDKMKKDLATVTRPIMKEKLQSSIKRFDLLRRRLGVVDIGFGKEFGENSPGIDKSSVSTIRTDTDRLSDPSSETYDEAYNINKNDFMNQ